ncbi:hypothetical protein [Lentzea sp. HUAS12]|uniref:effector-associated constant component EACC1 n=1 Tax=Lentzea sp. HUAS12 TaxID=2951806 RepID=UPI00209D5581|nr:hypothetical protein [Lentzea sp. HUAS12]USX54179.1 hypothetical protein ND450_08790 [Lentzea sp. HUAS12]
MHLVLSTDDPADLESLHTWLDGDPEIAVRKHSATPRPGELGALSDALVISVGSGGALTVLIATLRGFLQQPRRSKVKISVRRTVEGEVTAEIDADRVAAADVEAMLARILDKD